MTMLNVLLVVAGACLLYHTEYADNAMQKMESLPIKESSIFLSKSVLTSFMSLFVLVIEAGAVTFCTYHWFEIGNAFSSICEYRFNAVNTLYLCDNCRNCCSLFGAVGVRKDKEVI